MAFTWDPVYTLNLVLCIIILVFGCWGYKKKGDKVPLYIDIAFGLFGVSHLATLLNIKETLTDALIIVRALAYLIVVLALYKHTKT